MSTEPEREFVGGGRYALDRLLGKGGAGEVVLAYDLSLTRWVAIKRIPAVDAGLLQEVSVLASFQHPNIVTLHDVFQEGGEIFLVMEFVQGQTLEEFAEAMSEQTFRDFAAQCLEGLKAAHEKNIIHRDIKPGNIMLAQLPDGGFQVKLLDFGQSRLMQAPSLSSIDLNSVPVGSVQMMSPEQLNNEELDLRTDFYSLGCVFYQALTLERPFSGENVAEMFAAHRNHHFQPLASIRPDLPQPLTAWVERMFSLDRNDRPASAEEALRTLRATIPGPNTVQLQPGANPGVHVAIPVLKAAPALDHSAAPVRAALPVMMEKNSVPVVTVAPSVAGPVAKLVKPVSVGAAARPIHTAKPVKPSPVSSLYSPEPEPPKKPRVSLLIAAAAVVVLIAGGFFFISWAMVPKGELLYGADLSNGIYPPGSWTIVDGIMQGNGKSDALWTKKEYENFELHFDVRVAPGSNSGIFLRCPDLEETKKKRLHYRQTVLELEIIEGYETAGTLLTVAKPTKPIKLEPGKWHTFDIKAHGSIITVAVDGVKLYEFDLSKGTKATFNPDGTRNILAIALKDLPKKGKIGIQDWLGPVEYRNFRIKEL